MSLHQFLVALTFIVPFTLLFGILVGFIRKPVSQKAKVLWAYLLVALLFDVATRLLGFFLNNNLYIIPIFSLAELIIFCLYFQMKTTYFWLIMTGVTSVILYELFSVDFTNPTGFNAFSKVLTSFIVLLLSFRNYTQLTQMGKTPESSIIRFNAVVFLYFSLSLILYIPVNFLVSESSQLPFIFWNFNLLITTIFYGYIASILWNNGKNQKRSQFG